MGHSGLLGPLDFVDSVGGCDCPRHYQRAIVMGVVGDIGSGKRDSSFYGVEICDREEVIPFIMVALAYLQRCGWVGALLLLTSIRQ